MKKSDILLKLAEMKKNSPKKNFNQSVDMNIVLKNVNLKREEEKIDEILTLPFSRGKDLKICAFVDKELATKATTVFEKVIPQSEFPQWKDARKCKKLAREFDIFIAQATIMPQIAAAFGKYLGAKGKMPNPKMGCIIPPNADLAGLKTRLQRIVNIKAIKAPVVNLRIGMQDQSEDELAENIFVVFDTVKKKLPQEESQIKAVYIKLTMGPKVKLL